MKNEDKNYHLFSHIKLTFSIFIYCISIFVLISFFPRTSDAFTTNLITNNGSSIASKGYVQVGIPFAESDGIFDSTTQCRVRYQNTVIEAQFKTLLRYNGPPSDTTKPTRWVIAYFKLFNQIAAHTVDETSYTLTCPDTTPLTIANPLQVANNINDVTVNTGSMTFKIPKNAGKILESAKDNATNFEYLLTSQGIRIETAGQDNAFIDTMSAPTAVTILDQGPLVAKILLEGNLSSHATNNYQNLKYKIILTFEKGQNNVKMQRMRINEGTTGSNFDPGTTSQPIVIKSEKLQITGNLNATTQQVYFGSGTFYDVNAGSIGLALRQVPTDQNQSYRGNAFISAALAASGQTLPPENTKSNVLDNLFIVTKIGNTTTSNFSIFNDSMILKDTNNRKIVTFMEDAHRKHSKDYHVLNANTISLGLSPDTTIDSNYVYPVSFNTPSGYDIGIAEWNNPAILSTYIYPGSYNFTQNDPIHNNANHVLYGGDANIMSILIGFASGSTSVDELNRQAKESATPPFVAVHPLFLEQRQLALGLPIAAKKSCDAISPDSYTYTACIRAEQRILVQVDDSAASGGVLISNRKHIEDAGGDYGGRVVDGDNNTGNYWGDALLGDNSNNVEGMPHAMLAMRDPSSWQGWELMRVFKTRENNYKSAGTYWASNSTRRGHHLYEKGFYNQSGRRAFNQEGSHEFNVPHYIRYLLTDDYFSRLKLQLSSTSFYNRPMSAMPIGYGGSRIAEARIMTMGLEYMLTYDQNLRNKIIAYMAKAVTDEATARANCGTSGWPNPLDNNSYTTQAGYLIDCIRAPFMDSRLASGIAAAMRWINYNDQPTLDMLKRVIDQLAVNTVGGTGPDNSYEVLRLRYRTAGTTELDPTGSSKLNVAHVLRAMVEYLTTLKYFNKPAVTSYYPLILKYFEHTANFSWWTGGNIFNRLNQFYPISGNNIALHIIAEYKFNYLDLKTFMYAFAFLSSTQSCSQLGGTICSTSQECVAPNGTTASSVTSIDSSSCCLTSNSCQTDTHAPIFTATSTIAVTSVTSSVSVSGITDENAVCRYSTTNPTASYASMLDFTQTGQKTHVTTINFGTNSTNDSRDIPMGVRCQDVNGNVTNPNYLITIHQNAPDITTPEFTSLNTTPTSTSLSFTYNTSEPVTTTMLLNPGNFILTTPLSTNHAVNATGLSPSMNYIIQIIAVDQFNNDKEISFVATTTPSTFTININAYGGSTSSKYSGIANGSGNLTYSWSDTRIGAASNGLNRGLTWFNLQSIPPTAVITQALLKLKVSTGSGGNRTIKVNPLTQPAGFSINPGGTIASSCESTWSDAFKPSCSTATGSTAWTSSGGSFDSSLSFQQSFTATSNSMVNINITTLVDQWRAGTRANHGVLLRALNETSDPITIFQTTEWNGYAPTLQIAGQSAPLNTVVCIPSLETIDGIDNDCDGLIDAEDSDITINPNNPVLAEMNCVDNLDNDLDGAVDCSDSDCAATSMCVSASNPTANYTMSIMSNATTYLPGTTATIKVNTLTTVTFTGNADSDVTIPCYLGTRLGIPINNFNNSGLTSYIDPNDAFLINQVNMISGSAVFNHYPNPAFLIYNPGSLYLGYLGLGIQCTAIKNSTGEILPVGYYPVIFNQ